MATLDRRGLLGALAVAGLGWPGAATAATLEPDAAAQLRDLLLNNHLPFWRKVAGKPGIEGFDFNYGTDGAWLGPARRVIVGQARTLWLFARLLRSPFAASGDAAIASHGYAYLTRRFWDTEHGGFFWELNWRDHAPTKPHKDLYGQSFALFALSEYARATGRTSVGTWADRAFRVIDQRFRDPASGNYREFLLRDWSRPSSTPVSYLGFRPDVREQNTRIHLLEALTAYAQLRGTATVRARLAEVLRLVEAAVRTRPAYYFRQIDPTATTPAATEASYGHDVETIHLLRSARAVLGLSGEPAFYDRVLLDSFRLGEDLTNGGLFQAGPIGAPATTLVKVDWIEAEALLASLTSYVRSRRADHRAMFLRTLRWIRLHQADLARGGWYEQIDTHGRPSGFKADGWSGGYHAGRALLDGIAALTDAAG